MMIPIRWRFERKGAMPIIEARAEEENEVFEEFIIATALEIIKRADKYGGLPRSKPPSFQASGKLTVSFSLLFPTETNLEDFIQSLYMRD